MTGQTNINQRCSRGAALLLGLVLLTALLLVGLAGIDSMLFQQRTAGAFQQRLLAQQAAFVAEHWAKAFLAGADEDARISLEAQTAAPPMVETQSSDWWQHNAYAAGVNPLSGTVLEQPLAQTGLQASWLIAPIQNLTGTGEPPTDVTYYRILSRGSAHNGPSDQGGIAVLESIVARPWPEEYEAVPFPAPADLASPLKEFCSQFEPSLPCGQVAWRSRR